MLYLKRFSFLPIFGIFVYTFLTFSNSVISKESVSISDPEFIIGEADVKGSVNESETQDTCCLFAGDFNHDSDVDIADLTENVKYLFKSGPAPLCADGADYDSSCQLDISDLTYLVKFFFKGGPFPVCGCAD